ncbi:polysaccharide deacetylase [Levilactobacillus senmaizukei DSM 21775 = NBRC 103853]|uniref:Polysaccharide deacetylase n=1 Tax=Levilactobacillus senmaizukei DSM 21775 = NBRC 103853 TaxID=1423803 RepID=A0A0R2DDE1_9LACO|nr:polysaccharide deacetylase family protein [Levilactobacillus senmaizukei]KRN02072.1 polysaccharide deacetylase [Levilactobacillus senmaizukei DSM 21775 = NBRC 103853]
MTSRTRRWLLIGLIVTLVFGLGWTFQRQAVQQQQAKESYALPARFQHVKNGIMVFCYHRILENSWSTQTAQQLSNNSQLHEFNVPADQFEAQMAYLVKHHVKVISAATMTKMVRQKQPIKGKYVVLTFDDIDRTVIDHAVPVMRKYHLPFTAFVITGNTGMYREGSQMASWSQIKAVQSQYSQMTLGLHTHDLHHLNAQLQPVFMQPHALPKFRQDYRQSVQELYRHTGIRADSFAFPYGGGTRAINQFLAQQSLTWVATLDSGIVTDDTDLNATPRLIINQESWPSMGRWLTDN